MDRVFDIFLIIYISSYFGIFASYKGAILLAGVIISLSIVLCLVRKKSIWLKINNFAIFWMALYAYILVSSLLNLPNSFMYVIILTLCFVILFRHTEKRNWNFAFKSLKVVATVLALSIYCQLLFPNIFYSIARYWYYYSNQYDLVYRTHMISHQCSGLFYEVSFSAFFLGLGISITFIESLFLKNKRVQNIVLSVLLYGAIILTGKRSYILLIPVPAVSTTE